VAIIAGWGRGTWSEGSWGEPLPVEVTGEQLSTAQGTVVVSANADVPVTGNQLTQNFSPEYDLTLTGALPAGQISGSFTNRFGGIVFAGEVELPSSFTQTECLWEHGGTSTGSWLGVSKILDTYYLRFRAGEGSPFVQDNTPNDICLQNVAISSIPEFDGNTHTVVFSIKPNGGTFKSRILLWIDGREVINTQKTTELETGGWSAGGAGGWGAGFGSIAGGTAVTDGGTTQYQAATAWSGTIASPLRYYANQLADFGADVTVTAEAVSTPSGEALTTTQGSVSVTAEVVASPTGEEATSTPGSVSVSAEAVFTVTGSEATAEDGSVSVTAQATGSPTGVLLTTTQGSVTVSAEVLAPVTGISASALLESVTVNAGSVAAVTGIVLVTNTSRALVWSDIITTQSPNYSDVNTSQTAVWSDIITTQSPNYSDVNTSQTAGYSDINTNQTPSWTDIAA
jgi:hypothetical protein